MKHLHLLAQRDYIEQDMPYEEQIKRAAQMIEEAELILIGGGAGLSAAGGLTFGWDRFKDNFSDFIEKYDPTYMSDLYTAGFYPYETRQEYFAFWSRSSYINRISTRALPIYKKLYEMVKDKDHFVITTNADGQFLKSAFKKENIFATQGDYSHIQCSKPCHEKIYDMGEEFTVLKDNIKDCRIPSTMVPVCPVCGGQMEMNLRNSQRFVEDKDWHKAEDNYSHFLEKTNSKKTVLLELGLGFNTPIIIRYPFEKIVKENSNASLIRLNLDQAKVPESFGDRAIGIKEDIKKSLDDIYERMNSDESK